MGGPPNFGDWIFIVSTFNQGQSKLYINGTHVCTNDSTFTIQNTTTSALIGDNETNDQPFYGNIDDIRIYNRLLTEFEIQAFYKN